MPDPYIDQSLQTGFDDNTLLALKLDTNQRIERTLTNHVGTLQNTPIQPPSDEDIQVNAMLSGKMDTFDINQASISSNSKLRDAARYIQDKKMIADPISQGIGQNVYSPYDPSMDKFLTKDFGYRPDRGGVIGNEDFYYRNQYMQDGLLLRSTKNAAKFVGRVIPQAILKLGEGFGYVGSMIGSIGSTNYWADVADNAFSKWMEEGETYVKDQLIPVYHSLDYNNKGFFSKLTEGTFWTDSVADATAFMASAFVPAGIFGKLGKVAGVTADVAAGIEGVEAGVNWFGKAFSQTSKLGKFASGIGLGSPAQAATWTLNTAMEAAQEGAGVFKEMSRRMKEGRDSGDPRYINMSDEDIRKAAGNLAANTIGANFAILGLSNMWENKLFFGSSKVKPKIGLGADFNPTSSMLTREASSLGKLTNRLGHYGGIAVEGTIAEGFWEENAQLAAQRMQQDDASFIGTDGRKHSYEGISGFFEQYFKQIGEAFSGKDPEAMESIGLGALIGIGAGAGFSKLHGERKDQISQIKNLVDYGQQARQRLFTANDIYVRDTDGDITFKDGKPVVDPVKLTAKANAYNKISQGISFANSDEYFNNSSVRFQTKGLLADYVKSMHAIGIDNISDKLRELTPQTASIFGINPEDAVLHKDAAEFVKYAQYFEKHANNVEKLLPGDKPEELTDSEFENSFARRKAAIYKVRTDSTILSGFIADETSNIIRINNEHRNLNNTSLSESAVDTINLLTQQKLQNKKIIESSDFKSLSEAEKEYHTKRDGELSKAIDKYVKDNELVLKDSLVSENGFYTATTKDADGNVTQIKHNKEAGVASAKLASYNNMVVKNNYVDALFSDKEQGHDNFVKWGDTPLVQKVKDILEKAQQPTKKYKEFQKGDFNKVLALIGKMTFSENPQFTAEELQLQSNYAELIEELLPKYEAALNNQRSVNLKKRLESLQEQQTVLSSFVTSRTQRLSDAKVALEILREELSLEANKKRVDQRRIKESINTLIDNIKKSEEKLSDEESKLVVIDEEIDAIQQDIEEGSFKKLYTAFQDLKNTRTQISKDLVETRSLLDKVKKLLKDIISVFKQLYPTLRLSQYDKIFQDEIYGQANRTAYSPDLVESYVEVETARNEKQRLEQKIEHLDGVLQSIEAAFEKKKAQILEITDQINKEYKTQYLDLTQDKPEKVDPEEADISKGLNGSIPPGNNTTEDPDENLGFDGNTYQRPLTTKFFTTTFPGFGPEFQISTYEDLPQTDKDYFEFVDFMTKPEAAKKLNKATPKVLIVTRNNVKELKLTNVLSDRARYLDKESPEETHIEIIPVIEDEGYLFYVDKDLNKIGKVGEEPTKKIVRTYLRLPRFTEDEATQYLVKYTQDDLDNAVRVATDWRTQLLGETAKKPVTTSDYSITRGIPNKMKMQDGFNARNPVIGNLIDLSNVDGQTVRVFSDNTNGIDINGDHVDMPVGRPFIFTSTDLHDQYHFADNTALSGENVDNIVNVLKALLEDHVTKVNTFLDKDLSKEGVAWKAKIETAGGLNNLDPTKKKSLFFYLTKKSRNKENRFSLLNANYTTYLSSIIYFDGLMKDKSPHPNQVYFKGPNLVFGNSGVSIDVTDPVSIDSPEVRNFLGNQYHNVKYYTNAKNANKEYLEYYTEESKLQVRTWKNYAMYLLAETNPDGSKRSSIPVTTSIETAEQHKAKDTNMPYFQYTSRGLTIQNNAQPINKKAVPTPNSKAMSKTEALRQDMLRRQRGEAAAPIKRVNSKVEQMKQDMLDRAAKAKGVKEAPKKKAKDVDIIEEGDEIELGTAVITINSKEDLPADDAFRVSKSGLFKTEEDLDKVIAQVSKMLPQFPIVRLKNVIISTSGIEAWGQFVDDTIKIYEGAEEGTLYHETFEAVVNKILSDAEWRAINKEFNSRSGYFTDRPSGKRVKYSEATAQEAKEEIAEEFKKYMQTGVAPVQPQAKSYFKIIWDFIKSLFINRVTIADIFQNISNGAYAQSDIRESNRFFSNYSLALDPSTKRDLFEGATSSLFKYIFYTPESLSALDEIDETDVSIYDNIKAEFGQTITQLTKQIKVTKNEKDKVYLQKAVDSLQTSIDNWEDFIVAHKNFLKPFQIRFEQEEEYQEDGTKNRNDYIPEHFKTDGKRSASKSVKFLFGTLLKLQFNKKTFAELNNGQSISFQDLESLGLNTTKFQAGTIFELNGTKYKITRTFDGGVTKVINGKTTGDFGTIKNSMYLRGLVGYDEYMLKALDTFSGINDFRKVQDKLEEVAGIKDIEAIKNPEKQSEVISSMSDDKAVWTSLYSRLFGHSDKISEEAAWNLKLKFHNYISKQVPKSWLLLNSGNRSLFIDAVKRSFFETITSKMHSGFITNSALVFDRKNKGGEKTYTPKKAFKEKMSFEDFTKVSDINRMPEKVKNFVEFLGLDGYITPEFVSQLDKADKSKLFNLLLIIRNSIRNVKEINTITIANLDILGYTDNLVNFLDRKLNLRENSSQLMGLNNEMRQRYVTPSFVSRVFNEINNVNTLGELEEKFPFIAKLFSQDSIVLDRIFDAQGNKRGDYDISLDYIQGIKDTDENEGTSTGKLEFSDKYFQQFNATLQGLYYSLPADSETEWVFNFGEFISYSENIMQDRGTDIIKRIFLPKLKTEIDMTRSSSTLAQLKEKHLSNKKEGGPFLANTSIGTSLRFFKDYLAEDSKLLSEIYQDIDYGTPSEKIITKYNTRLIKTLKRYINSQVETTIDTLKANGLYIDNGNEIIIKGLNSTFMTNHSSYFTSEDSGTAILTPSQLKSIVEYQKLNSIIGGIESFKIVFGDPAQYKDWEKRAKSMFSPSEQVYYDSTGEFNTWLDENKNSAELGDEKIKLSDEDMFYSEFTNSINIKTVKDVEVADVDVLNDLISLGSTKFADQYGKVTEADGQSVGTMQFMRHIMIKSGWRWTKAMEAYYQYDNALMRRDMSQSGEYKYSAELKEIDAKIIKYYEEDTDGIELVKQAELTPLKTLMTSLDEDGNHILLKHSVHFMSYQVAKGFELLGLYKDMLKDNDHLFNFKSAQKVGGTEDIADYYVDPYTKSGQGAKQVIDMRSVGIQVETHGSGKGQTLGSQLTKLIYLSLGEGGVPIDYNPGIEGLTPSQRIDMWNALDEDEKLAISKKYRQIRNVIDALKELKLKTTLDTFSKLGIRWSYSDKDGISLSVDNLRKVREYIENELRRLEVDDNTMSVIDLTEDEKAFINNAEITPSYTTIQNLLWSIADKSVTSMKVNGKSYIQVASTFFNRGSRRAAYQNEDGRWVEVDNKADFDRLQADGKKMVMTSSELKFYTLGEDKINAMEVYLPHIYIDKINKKRATMELPPLTEKELMAYLNKNPKLLEGIGFRIPTQATSSIEFFKIKGFLQKAFGSAIVVPSAITTKAGSDFDVDKLNTYLNNWKLGKEGLPYYEEYKNDTNSSVQDRYTNYIRSIEKDYSYQYTKAKKEADEEYLDDYKDLLDTSKEEFIASKKIQEEVYDEGLKIFHELPYPVMQQYREKETLLRAADITGPEKTLEYLSYTKKWISDIGSSVFIQLAVKDEKGRERVEEVAKDDILPVMYRMIDNYERFLRSIGIADELQKEYQANKQLNRELNNDLKYKLAEAVAKANNYPTFEQFQGFPMSLQNTKGAIENNYFQAIRDILSEKDMYEKLLSPNSLQHILEMRDTVNSALYGEEFAKEKKELSYANFTSTEYIAEKRNQFTKGKYDIGIGAVANTNFANSQMTGIGISLQGGVRTKQDMHILDDLNEGYIDLPFKDVHMTVHKNKDGEDVYVIPISVMKDQSDEYTMDKISAYINGFVDVAKDPAIVEMGMHSEFASVYLLLERMGLTGKTTALFMYQPVIREYLSNLLRLSNKVYFTNSTLKQGQLQKFLLEEFKPDNFIYNPRYKFDDQQMSNMISKGEAVKIGKAQWTPQEKEAQYYAFITYLKLKMYSNHLLESIMASNHDTSSIRSPYVIARKDISFDLIKKGNLITKIEDGTTLNGVTVLREDTSVGRDIAMLKAFNSLFSNINLFALQKSTPKAALYNVAKRLVKENPYMSQDDFLGNMKEFESMMIDGLVNRYKVEGERDGEVVYNELYKFNRNLFKTNVPGNLKSQLDLIKATYPGIAKNNFFLSSLLINSNAELGLDLMELSVKYLNNDILTKEKITDGIRQLSMYNDEILNKFFKSVVFGAYLQFGIKFGRRSFVDLIPSEALSELMKKSLENIQKEDFSTFDESVQRSKWYKKGLIQEKTFKALTTLTPYQDSYVLSTRFQNKKGPATKTTQIYYGEIRNAQIVSAIKPILVWAGYEDEENEWEDMPNFIKAPGIRPEFLTFGMDDQDREGFRPKSIVWAMMKKGDFSFLFYQLFKKVGLDNPTMARAHVSKPGTNKTKASFGKKSISYLYKPVNKTGHPFFNEVSNVDIASTGEKVGQPSILDVPQFEELLDDVFVPKIKTGLLKPVFEPKLTGEIKGLQSKVSSTPTNYPSLAMRADAVIKIASGEKTTMIRIEELAKKIGIAPGSSAVRKIGGDLYNITNRGLLTIEEAGGVQKMLKSEAISSEEVLKLKDTKAWIEGTGKMMVYDITPRESNTVEPNGLPPIEPTCK